MKTTKTIAMAALLFPLLSMAQNMTVEQGQAVLQNKLGTVRTHESGVQIRPVSKEYINQALQKLGGNATVQFNEKDSMKFKSGSGVIIGNGGSGLVATSNVDKSGPIVVHPPLVPKTSITVVGRLNPSQGDSFCVLKYKMDATGTQILPGAGFESLANKCAKLGQPLRIRDEGLYLVYIPIKIGDSLDVLTNSIQVRLQSGENKVLALQEIFVPKQTKKMNFRVFNEITSPQGLENFYKILAPTMAFGYKTIMSTYYSLVSSKDSHLSSLLVELDIRKICRVSGKSKIKCDEVQSAKSQDMWIFNYAGLNSSFTPANPISSSNGWTRSLADFYHNRVTSEYDFTNTLIGSASDGEFVGVFPGSYMIEWDINGHLDWTEGIVVE